MFRSRNRRGKRSRDRKQHKSRFRFNPSIDIPYKERKALIKEYENDMKMNVCEYVIQLFLNTEFESKRTKNMMRKNMMQNLINNPNITLEIVEKYPEIFGTGEMFYLLHSTIEELYKRFPKKDVDFWQTISINPNITIDFVKEHLTEPFSWYSLSENLSISLTDIENNPHLPWQWWHICLRTDINIPFIKRNLKKHLDWFSISTNPAITMNDILSNPELPWSWRDISWNPNLTIKFVEENPNKDWNWQRISSNPQLTIDFIRENPDKEWIWRALTVNSAFTPEQILENSDLPWQLEFLDENKNLTLYFIEEHPELRLSKYLFSKNPNIWFEFVQGNYTREPRFHIIDMASNKGLFDNEVFTKFYSLLQMGEVPEEINDMFPEDIINGIIAEYTIGRQIRSDREVGKSGNTRLIRKSR